MTVTAHDLRGRPTLTGKIVAASTIGSIIEWYDFLVYGFAAALVFGRLFFPASDPTVSTLSALSVYAVGYVARPRVGALGLLKAPGRSAASFSATLAIGSAASRCSYCPC